MVSSRFKGAWCGSSVTVKKVSDAPVADLTRPSSGPQSTSGGSEPVADFDDDQCMGRLVFLQMEGRSIPLAHKECTDPIFDQCDLLRGDLALSHLPASCQVGGVSLCRIHRDVYMSLRGKSKCVKPDCHHNGFVAPDGYYYCPVHILGAVAPSHPPPKVSFNNKKVKVGPTGLESLPEGVILALYKRLVGEGLSDPEVVPRLTQEYGGDLLSNARIIHALEDAEADKAFEDMKRRLGRLDKVSPKDEPRKPFSSPFCP